MDAFAMGHYDEDDREEWMDERVGMMVESGRMSEDDAYLVAQEEWGAEMSKLEEAGRVQAEGEYKTILEYADEESGDYFNRYIAGDR